MAQEIDRRLKDDVLQDFRKAQQSMTSIYVNQATNVEYAGMLGSARSALDNAIRSLENARAK